MLESEVHRASGQKGKRDMKWVRAPAGWNPRRHRDLSYYCLSKLHAVAVWQGKLTLFFQEASLGGGEVEEEYRGKWSDCRANCCPTAVSVGNNKEDKQISNNMCEMQKCLIEFLRVKNQTTAPPLLTSNSSCSPTRNTQKRGF